MKLQKPIVLVIALGGAFVAYHLVNSIVTSEKAEVQAPVATVTDSEEDKALFQADTDLETRDSAMTADPFARPVPEAHQQKLVSNTEHDLQVDRQQLDVEQEQANALNDLLADILPQGLSPDQRQQALEKLSGSIDQQILQLEDTLAQHQLSGQENDELMSFIQKQIAHLKLLKKQLVAATSKDKE